LARQAIVGNGWNFYKMPNIVCLTLRVIDTLADIDANNKLFSYKEQEQFLKIPFMLLAFLCQHDK